MNNHEDDLDFHSELPPYTSSLTIYFDNNSKNEDDDSLRADYSLPSLSKRANETERDFSSKPIDLSENIDPERYGLSKDYDKKALSEFLKHEYMKVECSECKRSKYLLECFYDKMTESYICVKCSVNKSKEDIKDLSWEEEEKGGIDGFCRCSRLAHYKPQWSFLSRDKQTSKDKKNKPINEDALKPEKQCIYCRNYKKWEYLRKKMSGKRTKTSIYEEDDDEYI